MIPFFRDTSGVILLSRNSDAARRLANLFQERRVKKKYWSVTYWECGRNAMFFKDLVCRAITVSVPSNLQGLPL